MMKAVLFAEIGGVWPIVAGAYLRFGGPESLIAFGFLNFLLLVCLGMWRSNEIGVEEKKS